MSCGEVPNDNTVYSGPCALVTPPKDTKEQLRFAANRTSAPVTSPIASGGNLFHSKIEDGNPLFHSRIEEAFTPIRCERSHDLEPLPFRDDLSPNDTVNSHLWELVYSPLQASSKSDDGAESAHGKQKSLEGKCPLPFNLNEVVSTPGNQEELKDVKPRLPKDQVEVHETKPPYEETPPPYPHNQWPMCPPPHYWYHPYPPYGYHQQYGAPDNQSSPRSPYPTLYPKPQNGHYQHPYRSPPYGHFGKPLFVPHPSPAEYIREITKYDVICGRGGAVNNHPGNRRFRSFIQEFKRQYLNETKQRKPVVAMRVLEAVENSTPPGRFLVKYPHGYLVCSDDRAREKASQALREGAAKLRKEDNAGKQCAVATTTKTTTPKRGLNIGRRVLPNENAAQVDRWEESVEPSPNKKRRVDQIPTRKEAI